MGAELGIYGSAVAPVAEVETIRRSSLYDHGCSRHGEERVAFTGADTVAQRRYRSYGTPLGVVGQQFHRIRREHRDMEGSGVVLEVRIVAVDSSQIGLTYAVDREVFDTGYTHDVRIRGEELHGGSAVHKCATEFTRYVEVRDSNQRLEAVVAADSGDRLFVLIHPSQFRLVLVGHAEHTVAGRHVSLPCAVSLLRGLGSAGRM